MTGRIVEKAFAEGQSVLIALPGKNESGGRQRSGRVRKGNPALRRVPVEFAHAASRTKDHYVHSHFRAFRAKKNAASRPPSPPPKLIRVTHAVLKNRKPYTAPGTECREIMARGNTPRWIRMMKDCGIEFPAARKAPTQRA